MGLSFSVKFNERDFKDYINHNLKDKLAEGLRQGLNRAATGVRTEASDQIRNVFNPKAINKGKIFSEVTIGTKAQGLDIESLEARIKVRSKHGVSLYRFADSKRVQKQKGRPVKGRLPVAIPLTLKKSKRVTMGGGFIIRGKAAIFRGVKGKMGGRFKGQTYKSVAAMLQDAEVWAPFSLKVAERLQKEIDRAMSNVLLKL